MKRKFALLFCIFFSGWCFADSEVLDQGRPVSLLQGVTDSPPSKTLIAAHRGGYENDREDAAPENSVANIQVCQDHGFELYETDIQRTKDGHFVIVHDPTIDRETTGSGIASEMTLAELKGLKKRFRNGSESSERVATLEEFLREGKGKVIFKADLKPGVSKYFEKIMKVVQEQEAVDHIIFRVPYREADLFARYRAKGGIIAKHTLMFKVSSRKQIDDIKARFNSATIEIKLRKSEPATDHPLSLIRYASEQGFIVETHAEGDEADWEKLVGAGVRIFHTSAPSRVQKFLQSLHSEK